MPNYNLKPINVLLVEDNEADSRLMKETLKETKVVVNLEIVVDGVEAMQYLRKEGLSSFLPKRKESIKIKIRRN